LFILAEQLSKIPSLIAAPSANQDGPLTAQRTGGLMAGELAGLELAGAVSTPAAVYLANQRTE
jgi:hypothetical protein